MKTARPRTEVSFAPTRVFVEKYGVDEAAMQQKKFERPTWQQPTCEEVHPTPLPVRIPEETLSPKETTQAVFIILGAFGVGMGCGILLATYLSRA